MEVLYIDCFSGAAGDMILGALLDLDVPEEVIVKGIKALPVTGIELEVDREARHGILGARVHVHCGQKGHHHHDKDHGHHNHDHHDHDDDHHHHSRRDHDHHGHDHHDREDGHLHQHHRSFRDIRAMIMESGLKNEVKDLSIRIFRRIAEAEGAVHGQDPEDVTFHEVGALDSIADIVGAAAGFDYLKPDKIIVSPAPLGKGFVHGMHGVIPIPAPATMEILKGAPVKDGGAETELVTPTGAAIIMELADEFGSLPSMSVSKIGYGVGQRDLKDRPNLLRFVYGEAREKIPTREDWVVESNIDDMNPEFLERLMEKLFAAGAFDVSWSHLIMKKGRPGGLLRVLCSASIIDDVQKIIFKESTSIGTRFYPVERLCLERRFETVETSRGPVRIKISILGQDAVNALPEYEDCRRIADETGAPLKEVYQEAIFLYRKNKDFISV